METRATDVPRLNGEVLTLHNGMQKYVYALQRKFRRFNLARTYAARGIPHRRVFVKLTILQSSAKLSACMDGHILGSSGEADRLQHIFQRAAAGLMHVDLSDLFGAVITSGDEQSESVRVMLVGNAGCGKPL